MMVRDDSLRDMRKFDEAWPLSHWHQDYIDLPVSLRICLGQKGNRPLLVQPILAVKPVPRQEPVVVIPFPMHEPVALFPGPHAPPAVEYTFKFINFGFSYFILSLTASS